MTASAFRPHFPVTGIAPNLIMPSPRACAIQAPFDPRRITVISLPYGVLSADDDGTNPSPGTIATEGVDSGVLGEELTELGAADGEPPVGSGEASGLASGDAEALDDDGTGEDGTKEGVIAGLGGVVL